MIIHRLSYPPLVVTLVLFSWLVAQLPAAPPGVDYNLKLRFRISGVERSQVAAIERALNVAQLAPKIHVQNNNLRFVELSAELDRRADLGDIVKLINFALADTGAQPECCLIAYVSTDDVVLAKTLDGVGKLNGVDASRSMVDFESGELHLRLTGESYVSADDFLNVIGAARGRCDFALASTYKPNRATHQIPQKGSAVSIASFKINRSATAQSKDYPPHPIQLPCKSTTVSESGKSGEKAAAAANERPDKRTITQAFSY